jgi:hypothetical protein
MAIATVLRAAHFIGLSSRLYPFFRRVADSTRILRHRLDAKKKQQIVGARTGIRNAMSLRGGIERFRSMTARPLYDQ